METSTHLPYGVRIVGYYGYRKFKTSSMKGVFQANYQSGDCFWKLQEYLGEHGLGKPDNHAGWELENQDGKRFVYYFSDWTFTIYAL